MVFQDYELIPTKRVNRQRATRNIFFNRFFLASGGWNSVYFGALFSYAGILSATMHGGQRFGMVSRIVMCAPLFAVGYVAGSIIFGDNKETLHLLRNYPTYRKEFKMIRKDLYYQ